MAFTPGALRARLVVPVVRIGAPLPALPTSAPFALTVRQATEALFANLRARSKSRPAGCTPPALHGYTPGRITRLGHACAHRSRKANRLRTGCSAYNRRAQARFDGRNAARFHGRGRHAGRMTQVFANQLVNAGPGQGSEFVVRLPALHGRERSVGCLAETHGSRALT